MTSSQFFSRILFLSALSLGGCMMPTEPSEDGSGSDAAALAAVAAGECVPDCSGRSCGLDPVCGVSCGSCSTGEECNQDVGKCEIACVPDCGGRTCGIDPICGKSCGECATGTSCDVSAGQCVRACVPDCRGRTCGVDPVCGTSCGSCANGASCDATAGVCKLPRPGHACPYSSRLPRRRHGWH